MPTETVYGLACDATNPRAVARIFDIKGRPTFDPLIVHVASVQQAAQVAELNPLAQRLAQAFWPGPLTLVLPRRSLIPDLVASGLDTVGVRMPAHPLALDLITQTGRPLAAPSANPFGYISPTTARHVHDQLGAKIDAILDGGPCRIGLESTVVEVLADRVRVLRPGAATIDDLEAVAGRVERGQPVHERPNAPGMFKSHYAPRKPIYLLAEGENPAERLPTGLIAFRKGRSGFARMLVLSPSGDLYEAAANLFSALREMDESGVSQICVEAVPEVGIGVAMMDRIRRAVAR